MNIYRHMEAIVYHNVMIAMLYICVINFLDETSKEKISIFILRSNLFKCSLFFLSSLSLSFIDATTSTYFFIFSSSSHPLNHVRLIVFTCLSVSLVVSSTIHSLLFQPSFICPMRRRQPKARQQPIVKS